MPDHEHAVYRDSARMKDDEFILTHYCECGAVKEINVTQGTEKDWIMASLFERSEDGVTWEPIAEKDARERLSGYYVNVNLLVNAMKEDGKPVRTPWAFYRFVQDK